MSIMKAAAVLLLGASTSTAVPSLGGSSGMLSVEDFGAVGDGQTDCYEAIQRAIYQAQREYRALFVPAGVYRIDRGLVVNTTEHSDAKYSPATTHWRVAPLRLIGEGATNGEGQSVIFAGKPMAAVLTFASRQPGLTGSGANLTENHSLEQLALDANDLANFSAFAPAIVGSKWKDVSFVHGLVAGLYIGYGWIHNIEGCAFKGSGVAQLYLDRAVNSVNVLDNNFAAAAGVGIIANYGEVLRIVGNWMFLRIACAVSFESLGGPAIYANQIGALTISGNYYEGNNLNAAAFRWLGQAAGAELCAEVVYNGAGNETAGRWPSIEWSTNPARLDALVVRGPAGGPKFSMAPQPLSDGSFYGSAVIESNYHNPDQSKCPASRYTGVYVAGGQGVSVRNNDCRACAKRHPTRVCAAVGGANASAVERTRNTGQWSE